MRVLSRALPIVVPFHHAILALAQSSISIRSSRLRMVWLVSALERIIERMIVSWRNVIQRSNPLRAVF